MIASPSSSAPLVSRQTDPASDDGHIKKNTAIGIGVGLFLFLFLLFSFWAVSRYRAPPRKITYEQTQNNETLGRWTENVAGPRARTAHTIPQPASSTHWARGHMAQGSSSTSGTMSTEGYDLKRSESPTHMEMQALPASPPPAYLGYTAAPELVVAARGRNMTR